MRFPLDLIWIGKDGEVVRVDAAVPPRRLRWCLKARSVVEANAGAADAFVARTVSVPGWPELDGELVEIRSRAGSAAAVL